MLLLIGLAPLLIVLFAFGLVGVFITILHRFLKDSGNQPPPRQRLPDARRIKAGPAPR